MNALIDWLEKESERCRNEILKNNLVGLEREHWLAGQYCYNHIAAKVRGMTNES